jgi:hypothetical protein
MSARLRASAKEGLEGFGAVVRGKRAWRVRRHPLRVLKDSTIKMASGEKLIPRVLAPFPGKKDTPGWVTGGEEGTPASDRMRSRSFSVAERLWDADTKTPSERIK